METSSKATDILKAAILLERRGKAFYSQVAKQTQNAAVRKIFEMMAEEEDDHARFLSEQFAHYQKSNTFVKPEFHQSTDDTNAALILSDEIKKEISAASFEAAAISAAIDLENRSIELYTQRANEATDPNEKELYKMLADWEKTHHHLLHKMNEDLKEQIWYDNSFWPF